MGANNQVCPYAANCLIALYIRCIYIAAIAATKTAPAAIPPNAVACAAPAVLDELDVVVAVHAIAEPVEVVVMFGVAVTRTACPDREVPVIVTVVFDISPFDFKVASQVAAVAPLEVEEQAMVEAPLRT